MKIHVLATLGFLGCFCSLEALSLRIQNQTANLLTAEIFGANGSLLGQVEVPSEKTISWSDASFSVNIPSSQSVTPMTVHWFDCAGELFYISDNVTTGSLLQTNRLEGKKIRKTKKEPF